MRGVSDNVRTCRDCSYLTRSVKGGISFWHIMPCIAATTSSIPPEPSSLVRRHSLGSPAYIGWKVDNHSGSCTEVMSETSEDGWLFHLPP